MSEYCYKIEPTDDVYTVEQFKRACERGSFIDYDGFGSPAKGGMSDPNILVKPSRLYEIPADATHIVWFNR